MAFCHIKFQSIPLLMPFTLIDNPQFYCLEMSLSNILMIGLFRSNNRMIIFSKIEKEFIWQQTCKGPYIYTFMFHMEGVWPRGGLKFVTCLLILLFLNKRSVVRFWRWNRERSAWRRGWGVAHYAVKIILACGLMLKKKLLSLMIELVVYLNHFGVIHLWRWQKKLCDFGVTNLSNFKRSLFLLFYLSKLMSHFDPVIPVTPDTTLKERWLG